MEDIDNKYKRKIFAMIEAGESRQIPVEKLLNEIEIVIPSKRELFHKKVVEFLSYLEKFDKIIMRRYDWKQCAPFANIYHAAIHLPGAKLTDPATGHSVSAKTKQDYYAKLIQGDMVLYLTPEKLGKSMKLLKPVKSDAIIFAEATLARENAMKTWQECVEMADSLFLKCIKFIYDDTGISHTVWGKEWVDKNKI